MYKIDKGVVLPEDYKNKNIYNFRSMEVGDSIFVNGDDMDKVRRIENASHAYTSRHKTAKFTKAKVDGGYRIWRVS